MPRRLLEIVLRPGQHLLRPSDDRRVDEASLHDHRALPLGGTRPSGLQHQTGEGALTHEFEIRGVRSRRMVVPYHVWMLQRLAAVLDEATASDAGAASVGEWLGRFPGGAELLELNERLKGCRVEKRGALLFTENA